MNSGAIGKVAASGNSTFEKGDIVTGVMDWASYTLVPEGKGLTKIDASAGVPLSYYLGVLGKRPYGCRVTCIRQHHALRTLASCKPHIHCMCNVE